MTLENVAYGAAAVLTSTTAALLMSGHLSVLRSGAAAVAATIVIWPPALPIVA
jgi:hypothetical protein